MALVRAAGTKSVTTSTTAEPDNNSAAEVIRGNNVQRCDWNHELSCKQYWGPGTNSRLPGTNLSNEIPFIPLFWNLGEQTEFQRRCKAHKSGQPQISPSIDKRTYLEVRPAKPFEDTELAVLAAFIFWCFFDYFRHNRDNVTDASLCKKRRQ